MLELQGQWVGKSRISQNGQVLPEYSSRDTVLNLDRCHSEMGVYNGVISNNYGKSHDVRFTYSSNNGGEIIAKTVPLKEKPLIGDVESPIDISASLDDGVLKLAWDEERFSCESALKLGFSSSQNRCSEEEVCWEDFKQQVLSLPKGRYVFRGQSNHNWKLRTSFHRAGRYNLRKFNNEDIPELRRQINSISNFVFNSSDTDGLLNLAQHHGYPTPLLDWTASPYIASYFAFKDKGEMIDGGRCKVYVFDVQRWKEIKGEQFIYPVQPGVPSDRRTIDFFDLPIIDNNRALPQQALVSISSIDDIESFFVGECSEKGLLKAYTIDCSERSHVINDLSYMGINAASLFPGIDGLCEKLKEDNF